MIYALRHTTKYAYSEPVAVCQNIVRLVPRQRTNQRCLEHRLWIEPEPAETSDRVDSFGNAVTHFSLHEAHRHLVVTSTSRVEVDRPQWVEPSQSPAWEVVAERVRTDRGPQALSAFQFLFESPHVANLPALADYARVSFPPGRPVLEGVLELTSRVHADFAYDPQATRVGTTLDELLACRRGVCQDFAHFQIGCLRSLGLPARYVSGYLRTEPPPGKPRLVGADASHAWLAAYCGAYGWIDVDPTNDVLVASDHITLAWGRDYADVCPIQGVFVGGGRHAMNVAVDVVPENV